MALVAFLFPRSYYEQLVWEINYAHLNLPMLAYVALCVAAFAVGYRFYRPLAKPGSARRPPDERRGQRTRIPLLIIICALLAPISVYALVSILGAVPISTIPGVLLGQGSSLVLRRGATETFGERNIGFAFLIVAAFTPWLVWNALAVRASRARASLKGYVAVAFVFSLLLVTLSAAFLVQSRSQLLQPLFTALLAWAAFRMMQGRMSPRKLLSVGAGAFVFALGYFSLISITRSPSASDLSYAAEKLVAYTVGSYNRFAAALDGTLAIPGGGGYYWTQGLWRMPGFNGLFDLDSVAGSVFGILPPIGFSERTAYIQSAGLDESITSFTIFTHSYVDFGWFGFIPFIIYGFIASLTWAGFREGRSWALILYPLILWSIVEWRGYIEVARSLPVLVLVAAAVTIAEMLARRYAASVEPAAARASSVAVRGALREHGAPLEDIGM